MRSTGAATDPFVKEALWPGPKDSPVGFRYLGDLPAGREMRSPRRDADISGVVRTRLPTEPLLEPPLTRRG